MILNANLIKSILTIHDELVRNGLSLVYLGEFNHDITKMFTQMERENMEKGSEERTFKNRVYHVMVETLQNLNRHSDELTDRNMGKGLFMIGRNEESYFIITCNQVSANKKEYLSHAIDTVNAATAGELRSMYRKQIKEGELSEKGGAGLGLIDIARKTRRALEYQFFPYDHENFLFLLKVEVSSAKEEAEQEAPAPNTAPVPSPQTGGEGIS